MLHVRKARAVPWLQDLIGDADHLLAYRCQAAPTQQFLSKARVVARAVFGDVSDQLVAFDKTASGARVGAFESTEVQQRREDTVRLLRDLFRDWITDDIARAPDDVPVPKPATRAQGHYAVLGVLYNFANEHASVSWSVTPGAEFDSTGLDDDEQQKSLDTLLFHNLVRRMGGGYTLQPTGAHAYVNPELFYSFFPESERPAPPTPAPARPPGAVTKVTRIRDDLAFMQPGKLRDRVDADLIELGVAVEYGIDKTQMMLCGSILEAVLFDVLGRKPELAKSVHSNVDFPSKWSLRHYLDAAEMPLGNATAAMLSPTSKALGGSVTEHRDLIHAFAYVSKDVVIDDASADLMVSMLAQVVRDLRRAHESGVIAAFETT